MVYVRSVTGNFFFFGICLYKVLIEKRNTELYDDFTLS